MPTDTQATITDSLADLALSIPAATAIFQRHHLDYCCQGRRSLVEAASAKDLDPDSILDEILVADARRSVPAKAWHELPLAEVIDHILVTYHQPHRQELKDLQLMANKVEKVHADKDDCPHGLAQLLLQVEVAMLDHMAKEEEILFPLIRAGKGAECRGPVAVMEAEHHDHGANLERLYALTHGFQPPKGACTTWRALYMRLEQLNHDLMDRIHLENHVLFPRALGT
ncbi:MAG: iron-sulfur cluster repair protein YtfE [Planctomycetota bacterium]|nr:MAG: iron-sulfur cluster repair protein YtfE [Planctomycetota bacterium]